MNHPNIALMRAYGTDAAFKEKTANVQPIAQRIGAIAMGRSILASDREQINRRYTAQAEMMNTMFRVLELARMEQAIDNANHTHAPILLSPGMAEDLPVGMTEGMIRIASEIGTKLAAEGPGFSDTAKRVWNQSFANGKWKRTTLGLGAAAAAGLGTMALAKKVKNWASSESAPPAYNSYGYGANQLAHELNEYGEPQKVLPSY